MTKSIFVPIAAAARELNVAETRLWGLIRDPKPKKRIKCRTTKSTGVEIDITGLRQFVKNNPGTVDLWRQKYEDSQRRQII